MQNSIDISQKHFFFDGYDINNGALSDTSNVINLVQDVISTLEPKNVHTEIIPYFNGKVKKDGGVSAVVLGNDFHFTCHTFSYKNTVFIDIYGIDNCEEKLLPVILKYFPTTNYDLCRDFNNLKGNFGKHAIFELDKPLDYDFAAFSIDTLLQDIEMTPITDVMTSFNDEHSFDILQPIAESHISIHVTNGKTFIDVFSCKNFDDEKIKALFDDSAVGESLVKRGIFYK